MSCHLISFGLIALMTLGEVHKLWQAPYFVIFFQNPVTFAFLIPTAVFSPALFSHAITTSRRDQGLGLHLAQ